MLLLNKCGNRNRIFIASTTTLLALWPLFVICSNFHIEEFHSRSFVPHAIQVAYGIEQQEKISYNLTIQSKFPGRILLNLFVRKLPDKPGTAGTDFMKLRNMDFCKTLESLRNLSTAQNQYSRAFLISCPLVPGFYSISHGVLNLNLLPSYIEDGRYLVQLEIIQIYDEVTLLLNCKLKGLKATSADEATESETVESAEYVDSDEIANDPELMSTDGTDDEVDNEVSESDDEMLVVGSNYES